MPVLVGIPVLLLSVIIQTTVLSRIPMLFGIPDLVMLVFLAWFLDENVKHGWEWVVISGIMVSFVSALPFFLPFWVYLAIALVTYWLKNRIWQTPIMGMLISTLMGTVLMQASPFLYFNLWVPVFLCGKVFNLLFCRAFSGI
jgi:hypothetical protein